MRIPHILLSSLVAGLFVGFPTSESSTNASLLNSKPTTVFAARQEPRENKVEFEGGAPDVRLAGTLLLPATASKAMPVAGVVLVTGSGIQDRDETVMNKKPFRVLAEALVAHGYAVLRYDDRGTKALKLGESTGDFKTSTLVDTSKDADAALKYLADQPEVDASRVAICGHSTGGLEAAMLLGQDHVPGAAILIASPTVSGARLSSYQSEDILNATHRLGQSGLTDEQVAQLNAAQTELIMAYVSDDEERMTKAAEDVVRISLATKAPPGFKLTDELLAIGVKQALEPLKGVWMDHFLRYDPSKDLAASKVPVLAIFGGRDLQVAPAINVGPVTDALDRAGNAQSMVVTLPLRNHLFQQAQTGLPQEYGELDGEMGEPIQSIICDWLDRVLGSSRAAEAGQPGDAAGKTR